MSIIPKQNLVGYWPLDGHTLDLNPSATRNNGTVTGALPVPSQNPAIPASLAYKFNGSSDYIVTPAFSGGSDWTVNLWVNPLSLAGKTIIGKDDVSSNRVFQLQVATSGQLTLYAWNAAGTFYQTAGSKTNGLSIGKWTMVSISWNSTTNKITTYSNARLWEEATTTSTAKTVSMIMDIGRQGGASPTNFFSGSMQDIAYFNKALSQQEIQAIYNQTKQKYTTNKASWLASIANAFRTSDFFQFFFK